jgi:hypothetical protein
MSRLLCATLVLAGVTAVASSRPALPPAPKEDKAGPAEKAPTSAQGVVRALLRPVHFTGAEQDKLTSLKDVLEMLRKNHGLAYTVDERAFKHEGLVTPPVLDTPIVEIAPLPAMKAPLGKVLQAVLARVPVPSGATFMVRREGVEITTRQFQVAEVDAQRDQVARPRPGVNLVELALLSALSKGPGLGVGGLNPLAADDEAPPKRIYVPLVSVALEKQPFGEVFGQLRAQTNVNFVVDPALGEKAKAPLTLTLLNAPVDSALLVLAELAEVDFVWLDNIFFVTSPDKARRLRSKWPDRRGGGNVLLSPDAAAGGM